MEQKKVLIFADDPDLLFAYKTILSDTGFAVSTATNVSEAEKQLKLSSVRLAIIDITEEYKYDGYHALKTIKKIKPGIQVLSLLLVTNITANSSETDPYLADMLLEKPVNEKELIDTVNYLLLKENEDNNT